MARVNSVNFTGTNLFVVDLDPAQGNYTSIQDAIEAATATNPACVIINPGFYTEDLDLTTSSVGNVTIVGNNSQSSGQVSIQGNHTIGEYVGNISFESINFSATTGDVFSGSITTASPNGLILSNCDLNSQAGYAIDITATAPASFGITINGGNINANVGSIRASGQVGAFIRYSSLNASSSHAIDLDGAASFTVFYSLLNSGSGNNVVVRNASCSAVVVNCFGSCGQEFINFVAPATVTIADTGFSCSAPSGFWATGAAGTLVYAGVAHVDATTIDPALTQVKGVLEPYSTAGTSGTATRGTCGFDSSSFTVSSTGFVSLAGSFGTLPWTSIGSNQALDVNNGYIVSSGSLSLSLPAASSIGDTIEIVLKGGTDFTITQGAGQSISLGTTTSTVGAGGSVASTASGDSLSMICTTANTDWAIKNCVGNLLVS